MPRTTVISGFSPAGYKQYAERFIETFDYYWPADINLILYVEEGVTVEQLQDPPRIHQRSLWDCRGQHEFIERNKNIPVRNGKADRTDMPSKRAAKGIRTVGYTFLYDAVRFSRQLFIPEHASKFLPDGDIMIWMDADVVTFDHVPNGFVERLVGFSDLCTLGRDRGHTEIGFWGVTLNPKTRSFLFNMAQCCRDDTIFKLNEWHSGYVFDQMADKAMHEHRWQHRKLTGGPDKANNGHVWFQCELGRYTDHLKGEKRKTLGYSPERIGGWRRVEPAMVKIPLRRPDE